MPVYKYVNKNFFKSWSPEMAYVLGYFAADGYITVNKRGGQYWAFDIGDKALINKIKRIIKSTHKVSSRKRVGGKYTTYRLQIGSLEMCDDLRRLGFDERKTKRLYLPCIPDAYFSNFVRGYFDGDGNVWFGRVYKGRKSYGLVIQTTFTSCSQSFLGSMRKRLDVFSVKKGVLREGNGDFYRLTYSINNSLKLYDFMYNSLGTSELFLKRKKDVFERYIKMRS